MEKDVKTQVASKANLCPSSENTAVAPVFKRYIGVDISKNSFVVAYPIINANTNYTSFDVKNYTNDEKGITAFIETLDKKKDHVVMEYTGNYSLALSYTLYEQGFAVSVENPKRIKHFAKLMLSTTKTDKQDAQLIALFGKQIQPAVFQPKSKRIFLLKQKRRLLRQLQEKHTAFGNMVHAIEHHLYADEATMQHLKETIEFLSEKIKAIKKEMLAISKEDFEEQYNLLTSIPGIGERVAVALIEVTNGFTSFDNSKQLAKFLGLAPTYFQSGTSVNIKGQINRAGNQELRNMLYMGSLSAIRSNEPCKAMYERLKSNNKPSKVALVAVMHKMVRQAMGVVKNKKPFDPNYQLAANSDNESDGNVQEKK